MQSTYIEDGDGSGNVVNVGAAQAVPAQPARSCTSDTKNVLVGATDTTLLSEDKERMQWYVYNAGANLMYFRFTKSGASPSDMPLSPGATFRSSEVVWCGDVVAVSPAGTTALVIVLSP